MPTHEGVDGPNPWWTLVGCLYAAPLTAVFYAYSVFSSALKKEFSLSQGEIDSINTLPYALGLFSWVPGILVDKLGVRKLLAAGGVFVFCGATCQWVVARKLVELPESAVAPALTALAFVVYMGMTSVTSVVFPLPAQHFPYHRGDVVSIAKAFVGLAPGIVLQLFVALRGRDPDSSPSTIDFVLLFAVVCAFLTLGALAAISPAPQEVSPFAAVGPPAHARILAMRCLIVGAITLLALLSVVQVSVLVHRLITAAVLLLCLAFLAAPFNVPGLPPNRHVMRSAQSERQLECTRAVMRCEAADLDALGTVRTLNCWLLLFCGFVVIGGGSMLATNFGQIVIAAQQPSSLTTSVVTVFSCAQSLSRLSMGGLSDCVLNRGWAVPRPLFVASTALLMAAGHSLVYAATVARSSGLMLTGALLGGLGFGGIWPLLVVTVSELFGSHKLAQNYMLFDGGCGAVGNLVLANLLTSTIYERAAHKGDCDGSACFGPAHLVIAALALGASVCATVLALRSRQLYVEIAVKRRDGQTAACVPDDLPADSPADVRADLPPFLLSDDDRGAGA